MPFVFHIQVQFAEEVGVDRVVVVVAVGVVVEEDQDVKFPMFHRVFSNSLFLSNLVL